MKCIAEDCEKEATRKKACLCEKHYYRLRRHGNLQFVAKAPNGALVGAICEVEGCARPVQGRGLCNMHIQRVWREGKAGEVRPRYAEDGTGTINTDGYKVFTQDGKKLREHRLVAEKALGKPLPEGSVVHHLNGNRLDNRPCNLVVCPDESYHQLLHKRQKEFGYKGPSL